MLNLVSFQSINQRAKRQAERQYTQFQTSDYNPAITIGTFLTTVTCVCMCAMIHCKHACVSVVYTCICTCTHTCMHIILYAHTHTHTQRVHQ